MRKPVESLWTVEEVDEELARCRSSLVALNTRKAKDRVMEKADRLLDRRRMLTRCARSGVAHSAR